jgi:regulator of protease activity HflC (stomatin/prohibitin superfamily)
MIESNEYLNQVVEEQARVEEELRRPKAAQVALQAVGKRLGKGLIEFKKGATATDEAAAEEVSSHGGNGRASASSAPAVDVRVTGWFRWKTVVVPPNVYVVHTRRDHPEPLHVGLGVSFRFDPYTDSFLVIPAAVQTLLINAKCICAERQGVLVQAYVQWIVDDVYTAYRKLDFSDAHDPMRIVNIQLREQAEAAIKDKVATMSIDAILTDKQPIIEELTHRLRTVAEGSREGGVATGLGLKIVTVQIKEAVVSSTRVWENLQKPFRAERERLARLAELDAQQQVARRELENQQARETAVVENERALAKLRADQERETYDRAQAEKVRRHQLEQAAEQRAIAERAATTKANSESELELALQQIQLETRRVEQELAFLQRRLEYERARHEVRRARHAAGVELQNLAHAGEAERKERDLALAKLRQEIENGVAEPTLRARLIERLPQIAAALPKPDELRTIQIGPGQDGATSALVGLIASVMQGVEGALKRKET